MDVEHWRDVSGFGGLYQVSDMGNVRSTNYHNTGRVQNLIPSKSSNGYMSVMLFKSGKPKRYSVHRLVATAFIGENAAGNEVNHKNGDKRDNRLRNLEWCTPKENTAHAISVLHRRTRPVICIETGERFYSVSMAGKVKNVDPSFIIKNIKGKNSSTKGLHWRYA